MKPYERGDIVTYYFVIMTDGDKRIINAWTDDKQLAKFYMEFHKCPKFTLKPVTKAAEEFVDVINDNALDEIKIHRIKIRNPDGSKKKPLKYVEVPMTENERGLIRTNSTDLMGFQVNYSLLNEMMPYLKGFYRKGLEMIMLPEAIKISCYSKSGRMWSQCELDELLLFYTSNPEVFGI